jgi:mono/diheme cytochrome c family protein
LIKRNIVVEKGLLLEAHDPSPGKEFLASTDERFRPVHLATGPDGALYVADMYRGLVQHGTYVTPYLRDQTITRKLDLPIHRGRIWRIVPENWAPKPTLKLSGVPTAELVDFLSHPDGWYRDMAQRLIVERADTSVKIKLANLASNGTTNLGRFHALWALDGLHLNAPAMLFRLMHDADPLISNTAVRLLEPMAQQYNNVRDQFGVELLDIARHAPVNQVLQVALSAGILARETSHQVLARIAERYDTSALVRDAILSSLENNEFAFLQKIWNSPAWQENAPSKSIFLEMLTASVVRRREPKELGSLLSMLAGTQTFGWKEKTVLTALSVQAKNTNGKPVRIAAQPRLLSRPEVAGDEGKAHALLAMFEWPGHVADTASLQTQNPLNEAGQKQFVAGRQLFLTTCAACHGSDGAGLNRFAPPLIGSDWVLGDEKRLVLLVLHGLEGPVDVNGKRYDAPDILPVMPAHSTLDDGSIAAILTYIRNEWGNSAGAVSGRVVSTTRHTSQGRVVPWTAAELNEHVQKTK